MEHNSATKENEILTHTTIRVNIKNVVVNKKKQSKDHTLCDFIYMKYAE